MTNLAQSLTALVGNQLFAGGFLLMISGAVMAACRRVPHELWIRFLNLFTVSVTVNNTDSCYNYLRAWLNSVPYGECTRRLEVHLDPNHDVEDDSMPATFDASTRAERLPKFLFTPADGIHFFRYKGKLLWLTAHSEKANGSNSLKLHRTITVRYWGRSQRFIREIMEEASILYLSPVDDHIRVSHNGSDYWGEAIKVSPRQLDSLILPDGTLQNLLADVESFLENQAWYTRVGIPYRRGYLLEGVPGSGKSTTVAALATHFHLPLYILHVNNTYGDSALNKMLANMPPRCILLCEDIDASFKARVTKQDNDSRNDSPAESVTFSGFLNAIDGISAAEGRLLFMTTNYVEHLDPALIRAGRIDKRINYTHATQSQIVSMYKRFFPANTTSDAIDWAYQFHGQAVGMSAVQGVLLELTNTVPQSLLMRQ